MKKSLFIICLFFLISCKKEVSELVIYTEVVQDYGDIFSEVEEQKLSEKIISYEKRTTNQICVYTINALPNTNETALQHATTLASNLGVGRKDKNNGLLLLISKTDRKIAIATGIGTEKTITDLVAKSIIEDAIVPKFVDSLYFKGVTNGLDSIIKKW